MRRTLLGFEDTAMESIENTYRGPLPPGLPCARAAFWSVLLLLLPAIASLASASKLAKDLNGIDKSKTVDVIVQFSSPLSESHHTKVKQHGGSLKRALGAVKGALYSVPAEALERLAADPSVVYVSPDRKVYATLDYATPTVNASIATQSGWDGTGIGVAIIDSGVYSSHPDLLAKNKFRVVYSEAFNGSTNVADEYGHGTHVAGIIGGNGASSTGSVFTRTFKGVAPEAKLINLKVLDASGQGTDSGVIAAISRAIQLKAQYNIRVINLSLGHPVYESYTTDPLGKAVAAAWQAGIVVVVAAGNEGRNNSKNTYGYGTIASPGNHPLAITVGAMKTVGTVSRGDDLIASYSAKGPTSVDHVVKPDLVAPGNRIISLYNSKNTLPTQYPENRILWGYYATKWQTQPSATYYRLSGTSMATPVVSGTVAALLEKSPTLSPDQVKARLMKTATKSFPATSIATDPVTGQTYVSQYDLFTIGAGYLDTWAALNS
ncbi:MAG: S8 family peptidase, partial [Bryobacteraceae bacterium]